MNNWVCASSCNKILLNFVIILMLLTLYTCMFNMFSKYQNSRESIYYLKKWYCDFRKLIIAFSKLLRNISKNWEQLIKIYFYKFSFNLKNAWFSLFFKGKVHFAVIAYFCSWILCIFNHKEKSIIPYNIQCWKKV